MIEAKAIEFAQLLLHLTAHVLHHVQPIENGSELAALLGIVEPLYQHRAVAGLAPLADGGLQLRIGGHGLLRGGGFPLRAFAG